MNTRIYAIGILVLSSILAAPDMLSAQEQQTANETKVNSKFGIKGGINLTNLYVDNASDENMKLAFNAGIFTKLAVAKGFSIQPELLYSSKGSKLTYSNFLQGSGEYRFNLNYLELPVLAVVNLGKNFNIHAGPYVGYLLSANIKDVDNNGTINGVKELNADNFERFDYGVAGGLGFDIENFSIGARYNYGLNEIGKTNNLSGQLTKNSKNAGLSVYIGIGF